MENTTQKIKRALKEMWFQDKEAVVRDGIVVKSDGEKLFWRDFKEDDWQEVPENIVDWFEDWWEQKMDEMRFELDFDF